MKIEIARAIRAAETKDMRWERDQVAPYSGFDDLQPNDQQRYLAMAEAALERLRTPSREMVWAGEWWQDHCSDIDSLFGEMIAAALHPEDVQPRRNSLYFPVD